MSLRGPLSTTSEPNWSDELELIHEEASRDHFLDVRTRAAMLEAIGPVRPDETVLEIGCSSGYMLEGLHARYPSARLAGLDMIASGLRTARHLVPEALLGIADIRHVPIASASVDVVLSANVLEHVPEDVAALREICRVLRPRGRAALVVPAGPGTYDYYDRFLRHERRYKRGELPANARTAGLQVIRETPLGTFIYPPFWLVKKYHRLRYRHLAGTALAKKVAGDIGKTKNSLLGRFSCALEQFLDHQGVRLPFGIRVLVLVSRPDEERL